MCRMPVQCACWRLQSEDSARVDRTGAQYVARRALYSPKPELIGMERHVLQVRSVLALYSPKIQPELIGLERNVLRFSSA